MEKFKKAAKLRLRFSTSRGQLAVEDLYDLNLTSLNEIAKSVNRELKASEEESFIETKSSKDTVLELKLEILKEVIADKIEDRDKKKARAERQAKMANIAALIESKQMEALGATPLADLQKMMEEMQAED